MALGTAVLGFDGFGGRDFLFDGVNSSIGPYPDFDGLAQRIVVALAEPQQMERLIEEARTMPPRYGYGRFRAAWNEQIARFLTMPVGTA